MFHLTRAKYLEALESVEAMQTAMETEMENLKNSSNTLSDNWFGNQADINLSIALKVRDYLEANDVNVVMTRETAQGLYDENSENKKVQDMKRRIAIIEEADPLVCVSIHQNSYTQEYVKGAQVFYYEESKEGKRLSELLQESLRMPTLVFMMYTGSLDSVIGILYATAMA